MKRILVLGGTGFVGRHFCEKAGQLHARSGTRLTVPTRKMASARPVQTLPWVDVIEANINDGASLVKLVAGHDVVVNLVARLHGTETQFQELHVGLPEKLVRACQATGVQRLVHVSALGASAQGPSRYLRSKAAGEAALTRSTLDVTVLRPSVIFGADDRFLNLFAQLQRWLPVIPLAGVSARFQPVWVEDMALALVRVLSGTRGGLSIFGSKNHSVYEACGPDVFTLKELVQLAGICSGHPRPVLKLPGALARLQALFMELAPGQPLMSRDNLDSMQVPNIASGRLPGLAALSIQPMPLSAIAPQYLGSAPGKAILVQKKNTGRF